MRRSLPQSLWPSSDSLGDMGFVPGGNDLLSAKTLAKPPGISYSTARVEMPRGGGLCALRRSRNLHQVQIHGLVSRFARSIASMKARICSSSTG